MIRLGVGVFKGFSPGLCLCALRVLKRDSGFWANRVFKVLLEHWPCLCFLCSSDSRRATINPEAPFACPDT